MSARISDQVAARARTFVTTPVRAAVAGHGQRTVAWAILKLHRRQRIEAAAIFRHHPGDAA